MEEIEKINYKLDSVAKEMIKKFIQDKSHNDSYTKKAMECLKNATTQVDKRNDIERRMSSGGYEIETQQIRFPESEIKLVLGEKNKDKCIKKIMSALSVRIHEYEHKLSSEISKEVEEDGFIEEGYADLFSEYVMDYVIKNYYNLFESIDINGLEKDDWNRNKSDIEEINKKEIFGGATVYLQEDEFVFGMSEMLRQINHRDVEAMLEYIIGDKQKWKDIGKDAFGEEFEIAENRGKIIILICLLNMMKIVLFIIKGKM